MTWSGNRNRRSARGLPASVDNCDEVLVGVRSWSNLDARKAVPLVDALRESVSICRRCGDEDKNCLASDSGKSFYLKSSSLQLNDNRNA